jgi:chitinase
MRRASCRPKTKAGKVKIMLRRRLIASLGSSISAFALVLNGCSAKPGPARCEAQDQDCNATTGSGGGATVQGTSTGSAGSTVSTTTSTTSSGTGTGGAGGAGGSTVDAGRAFTKRIVAYLATWGGGTLRTWATDIPWQKVSHVHIAFATPSGSTINLGTQEMYLDAFVTAGHAAGAKILVSLGGEGGSAAIAVQYAPATVDAFVTNIANYVDAHNLDGIDVDIEGSTVNANYPPFVDKLVAKLRPKGKLVSSALAQWFASNLPAATYGQFDYVSIMSFDHCSTNPMCDHSTYDAATKEMDFFRSKGVPMDRLVLGVPFYCWCWGPDCGTDTRPSFAQVLVKFPNAMDRVQSGSTNYSCNGPATILQKTQFARNYGGVMIWHIAQDPGGSNSLLKVISDNL